MLPYIILLLIPISLAAIKNISQTGTSNYPTLKMRSRAIDGFMIVFLILLACRGLMCGNDTIQYLRLYNEYNSYGWGDLFAKYYNVEIAYKLFNKFIGEIFNNFQVFLLIESLICVLPLWYFYNKETENPLLTIALFVSVAPFVMYFSGIRQSIAISIGLIAWYAAKNKRIFRFLFLVLLAMLFHTSAFVLLVLYPLYHLRITKKWLWFVVPAILVVYLFREQLFDYIFRFLWKDYDEAYDTGAYMVLFLLVIFTIYSYVIPDNKLLDQDTIALRNILLLTIVIQIFAMLHPLSMRMNYYFLIFIPILIPKIANRGKARWREVCKLSIVVMIVFFMGYFLRDMIIDNDTLNIFPYIPYWNN